MPRSLRKLINSPDETLMGNAYNMYHRLQKKGFFRSIVKEPICQDRRYGYLIGKTRDLEFWCAECRKGRDQSTQCPLCSILSYSKPPLNKQEAIRWKRKFYLIANAFPYLPNHFLLISIHHETQNLIFENGVFKMLCRFYECFLYTGTIFFNHYAGNSLEHFHVHHTSRMDFPIYNFIRSREGRSITDLPGVQIFHKPECFIGIGLFGVQSWEFGPLILGELERRNYLVNIIFTCVPEEGPVCLIIVRLKNPDVGSTEVAGFVMTCSTPLDIDEICRSTIIDQGILNDILQSISVNKNNVQ